MKDPNRSDLVKKGLNNVLSLAINEYLAPLQANMKTFLLLPAYYWSLTIMVLWLH